MNKNDLRYIKTEKAIKEAFYSLINEAGFENTSVTDICERCLISRHAFYTHYQSKEDLLEAIYIDVQYMFMNKFVNLADIRQLTAIYLNIINDNRNMFYSLLKCPTLGFKKIVMETVIIRPSEEYYKKKLNYEQLPIKVKLTLNYLVDAMISFTTEWLSNYDQLPLAEAIDELTVLCTYPTNHNYELLEKLK